MLSSRAIAIQGVGFGPFLMALQGFGEFTHQGRDTHDGGWRKIREKKKKNQSQQDKEEIHQLVTDALYGKTQNSLQTTEKVYIADKLLHESNISDVKATKSAILDFDDDEIAMMMLLH